MVKDNDSPKENATSIRMRLESIFYQQDFVDDSDKTIDSLRKIYNELEETRKSRSPQEKVLVGSVEPFSNQKKEMSTLGGYSGSEDAGSMTPSVAHGGHLGGYINVPTGVMSR